MIFHHINVKDNVKLGGSLSIKLNLYSHPANHLMNVNKYNEAGLAYLSKDQED